jgi:hypothetical protein
MDPGIAVEGEGAGTARVNQRGVAAGTNEGAAWLDLDLAVEAVAAGRNMDRLVRVQRRLERRAVVGDTVALGAEIPHRNPLAQLVQQRAQHGADATGAIGQVAKARPPCAVAVDGRDQQLVFGGQLVRGRELVDLLSCHGSTPRRGWRRHR